MVSQDKYLELKLGSNKANLTAEGHRLDNLPVLSMPWRPCTDLCFFLLNINYRQIKSTLTLDIDLVFSLFSLGSERQKFMIIFAARQ